MQNYKPNIFMRIIKGVIGSALLTIGLMFVVITVDDKQFLQNVLVRIIGVSSIFIGIHLLHKQFHPHSYNKPGTPK
ncbi:hypothetical protein VO178_12985 [Lysinibacillus fusiformis]|uniref:hypothetical protein n=1 Tax=Lysinibacillus fusiformis TaxID=28031 RepID=UPI000AB7CC55|nr:MULTISPECIES: hypothetical protein [Lysinibacillus]WRS96306.1 hypothetical protein VO178_12985 [Lysinibacillus fusiformis]